MNALWQAEEDLRTTIFSGGQRGFLGERERRDAL